MKINKTQLLKALETVKPGLANKEMIEQSTSFCFMNGHVVTFNDEISVQCPVDDLELEGAINASELYAFMNKSKSEFVEFDITENEILLKSGRSKAGLTLQSEIKLPIEEIGEIKKWKKLPEDFLKGLKFAMGCCSSDMSKPVLTCVHVNKTTLESTDNYRLSSFTLKKKMTTPEFLMPAQTCIKIIRMAPIEIAEGVGWVHFKTKEGAVLSCRTFEDKYPDIETHLTIDGNKIDFPKTIVGILDRAGVFAKRDVALDEEVLLHMESGNLQIKSTSTTGWFAEKAKIEYKGKPVEFKVTPYLLRDILEQTNVGKINNNKLMFEGDNWKYVTLLKV